MKATAIIFLGENIMNRKPKYLVFATLEKETYKRQFYRIPLSAIEVYNFEQSSINYVFDAKWSVEMTKIYVNQFTFITKQTSETIAFRDALERKEKLLFITIIYEDNSTTNIYDDGAGIAVAKWLINDASKIIFLLFYKEND